MVEGAISVCEKFLDVHNQKLQLQHNNKLLLFFNKDHWKSLLSFLLLRRQNLLFVY